MPRLLEHKRAHHDYSIEERFEAGIELLGSEVKSLRAGQGKLLGAHVVIRGGEAYVLGMQVPPYQPKNASSDFDPMRTRKLLLTKKELAMLAGYEARKGFTLIPTSVHTKGKKIKIEVAVAKGKKLHDRREDIKKREDTRAMARVGKGNRGE
ncbi:MAG TPA: SsrA-binding protein SmpB [Candidatus Paceibacterota bacterium]